MKKFFAIILSVILLFSCTSMGFAASAEPSDFGAYKSVVILGIDGAGAFFDNANTPNMDKIFSDNAFVSHYAKAESTTSSAQNWASILTGVPLENHKIDNDIAASVERTSSEKYPSIFRTLREAKPTAVLASICHWNPINFGIIENDIGVYKDTGDDEQVCQKVVDYLTANTPDLLFVQLDDVDHVGHTIGFGTKAHLEEIAVADSYIGRIYNAIEQKGALEDTLFIVVSDHGGTRLGGHGGSTLGEKLVYVGVKGKTVQKNETYGVRNRDVASIALYALGVEPTAPDMASKVPNGLFAGQAAAPVTLVDQIYIFFEKIVLALVNSFADFAGNF